MSTANIPVQVGNSIVDCVDLPHAIAMGKANNVTLVHSRKLRTIVRVIVHPTVMGKGDVDIRTSHADSRRAHKREALFNTDDSATQGTPIAGMPFVFAHKPIPPPLVSSPLAKREALPSRASRRRRDKK